MKAMTLTAVMALLVAIPFIIGKKRLQPIQVNGENAGTELTDENLRYDIDDFLT